MTGDSLVSFTATDARQPASQFASLDVRGDNPVLDFDAALNEYAGFHALMPRHYAGGAIDVTLVWAASSATSGAVRWSVRFKRYNAGASIADGFYTAEGWSGAQVSANGAVPGTSGQLAYTTLTFSAADAGSLAAGDAFRMFVKREATDAADTAVGDAELLAVELREG